MVSIPKAAYVTEFILALVDKLQKLIILFKTNMKNITRVLQR